MKNLTYIFFVFLIILASGGGCGSSKNMINYGSKDISSQVDTVAYVTTVPEPKPEPKLVPFSSVKHNSNEMKDGKSMTSVTSGDVLFMVDSTQHITSIGNEDATGLGYSPTHSQIESQIQKYLLTNRGTLVYKVDSVLTIGVVSRVEARIIKKTGQSTAQQLVQMTTHTTTGVIRTEIIQVGNIMDMNLIALQPDVFTISKVSSGDQPVDGSTVTEWLWGVTANKVGNYDLILKATINENGTHKDKIVFDKQINVKNKPKKRYNAQLEIIDSLKRYVESTVRFTLKEREGETYNVDWGGNGKLKLEFDGNVEIKEVGDYTINDDKSLFVYEWKVTPMINDTLHYTLKIIGDYDETIIYNKQKVHVDKNFKGWFNNFIEGAGKKWYWVLTVLVIPLYQILQKRYFPKFVLFKKRRRKPKPKPN